MHSGCHTHPHRDDGCDADAYPNPHADRDANAHSDSDTDADCDEIKGAVNGFDNGLNGLGRALVTGSSYEVI
jgi:hypothetical protein